MKHDKSCVINSIAGGDHAYCICPCHFSTLPAIAPSRQRRPINPEMIHPLQFVKAVNAAGFETFDAHNEKCGLYHCVGMVFPIDYCEVMALRLLRELIANVEGLNDMRAIMETMRYLETTLGDMIKGSELSYDWSHPGSFYGIFPKLPWPL